MSTRIHRFALAVLGIASIALLAWAFAVRLRERASSPTIAIAMPAGERDTVHAPNVERAATTERARTSAASPAPLAPIASGTTDLQFAVLDADGSPIRGARVALCNSTLPVPQIETGFLRGPAGSRPRPISSITDEAGRARFAPQPKDLDFVLVVAAGHLPLGVRRDIEWGEQTVVFPGPKSIAGRVTVEGRAPSAPCLLKVRGFRDPCLAWCPIARAEAEVLGFSNGECELETDAEGGFALSGIAADQPVEIAVPPAYWPAAPDAPDAPDAHSPAAAVRVMTIDLNVKIDLRAAPRVVGSAGHGTFAERDHPEKNGEPVLLTCRQTAESGSVESAATMHRTGAPFSIPFASRALTSIELEFRSGAKLLRSVARTGRFDRDVNFGWIDLDAAEGVVSLSVTDVAGQPIAGAKARCGPRTAGPSGPDGALRLTLDSIDAPIQVGAFGYELASTFAPQPLSKALIVRLPDANRLRVAVSPAPGFALPAGLELSMRIPQAPSPSDPENLPEFADVRGACPSGGGAGGESRELSFTVPPSGVIERSDLPVGLSIVLRVRDGWGELLLEDQLVLQRGERREWNRALAPPLGRVRARVVTREGEPIAGAKISFERIFSPVVTADADGAFEIADVATSALVLHVSAEGFASRRLTVGRLDPGDFVELERAHLVWVDVFDEHGRRVDARVQAELAGGGTLQPTRIDTGRYRFDALPLSVTTVRAEADPSLRCSASIAESQSAVMLRFGK